MASFPVRNLDTIRSDILRDWFNLDPTIATDSDSDNYIRASGFAASVEGLYAYITWALKQFFPDTAEDDYMEKSANAHVIFYKAATTSAGSGALTGDPGSAVPIGTTGQLPDGMQYATTAAGEIGGDGTATIPMRALLPGIKGNLVPGTALNLVSAPPGVDAAVSIVTMTSGTDRETPGSLLMRLLQRLRNPPAGGNQYDYFAWAMSVPGVTQAYVYPTRRGIGTTDTVILSNGELPSSDLLAACSAFIQSMRPSGLTPDMTPVLAPTFINQANAATVVLAPGYALGDVDAPLQPAVRGYYSTISPGGILIRNRIGALINDTPGIVDYNLTSPAANVATTVDATHLELIHFNGLVLSL